MDWKEFVASLTDSLAWPAAIAFIVFLLRVHLRKVIRSLRRIEYGQLGADFGARVEEAEAEAEHAALPAEEPTIGPALSTELSQQIATAPRAAVIEAWLAVDHELQLLAGRAGIDPANARTTEALVADLASRHVIDSTIAVVIESLKRARNVAAHVHPYTVERSEVVDYVKLAGRVRDALRAIRKRIPSPQ